MMSMNKLCVGGIVIEGRDETASVGSLIDDGAARVTV